MTQEPSVHSCFSGFCFEKEQQLDHHILSVNWTLSELLPALGSGILSSPVGACNLCHSTRPSLPENCSAQKGWSWQNTSVCPILLKTQLLFRLVIYLGESSQHNSNLIVDLFHFPIVRKINATEIGKTFEWFISRRCKISWTHPNCSRISVSEQTLCELPSKVKKRHSNNLEPFAARYTKF